MPTIKLTPSTYYSTSTTYLQVSNASNMYDDCDSTTHSTIQNTRTSTTSYYIYLRGFDFSQVPSSAIVSDFTIRLKGNYSGGYSQNMYLYDGTSTSYGSASSLGTSVATREFSCNHSWADVVACGSDFGIRINCRRSSRNTTAYFYIYGAEIEVTYTLPTPRTITTSVSGNGTINPSGTNTFYDGDEITLTINPTNKSDQVTATRDGADITDQLVAHGSESSQTFTATTVDLHDIQSGSYYAQYAIGYTAEDPYNSSNNMYASDVGYADYIFNFSDIPSNATIEGIEVRVYGHRESATIDSSHISSCQIYNGSTAISDEVDFPSTSPSMITLEATSLPARSQMSNVTLRHNVGYYGGLVLGISFVVTYSTGSGLDHYTYTFTVSADTTIAVTIGSVQTNKIWLQVSGVAKQGTMYVKSGGVWAETTSYTDYLTDGMGIEVVS